MIENCFPMHLGSANASSDQLGLKYEIFCPFQVELFSESRSEVICGFTNLCVDSPLLAAEKAFDSSALNSHFPSIPDNVNALSISADWVKYFNLNPSVLTNCRVEVFVSESEVIYRRRKFSSRHYFEKGKFVDFLVCLFFCDFIYRSLKLRVGFVEAVNRAHTIDDVVFMGLEDLYLLAVRLDVRRPGRFFSSLKCNDGGKQQAKPGENTSCKCNLPVAEFYRAGAGDRECTKYSAKERQADPEDPIAPLRHFGAPFPTIPGCEATP